MLWYGVVQFEDGSIYQFYAATRRAANREIDIFLRDYDNIKEWHIFKYGSDVYYVCD